MEKIVPAYPPCAYSDATCNLRDAIKSLQSQLAEAKAENEYLCDLIEDVRQENADYLAGTLEEKLKGRLATAGKAIDFLNKENKGLRTALVKINNGFVANMKPNSVALYQSFVKETAEQALSQNDKEAQNEPGNV